MNAKTVPITCCSAVYTSSEGDAPFADIQTNRTLHTHHSSRDCSVPVFPAGLRPSQRTALRRSRVPARAGRGPGSQLHAKRFDEPLREKPGQTLEANGRTVHPHHNSAVRQWRLAIQYQRSNFSLVPVFYDCIELLIKVVF